MSVCLVHACASVKLCMCVLILVAATRSYSRSTGALHTPDTFGAAGEGWVHLFLRTSPTHSALIFVRSVFFLFLFSATHLLLYYLSACFFNCPSASVFCCVGFFYILLQDVDPCSGIACFRPFSCQLTTILPILPMPICFICLALLPPLCRDTNTFSCVSVNHSFSPSGTCSVS